MSVSIAAPGRDAGQITAGPRPDMGFARRRDNARFAQETLSFR